ncbi:hypothetical protein C464_14410 [Halorubrum coriense DSM 10284]|uniref:DUF7573 domain-containing protein n=1 Tax=Halorubrum coriense DSM 10284 TaxID=1227466 RepID=M0E8F5_9EURY|nr:hypothetical protein [Halorubrum coriense]ELZ44035.1 hypothetical protein C464_14410 [Halorubrum coriense DSM 10284]
MSEDRSLDDFAAANAAGSNDAETESDGAETTTTDRETADPDGVEPAVATSTWHADGAACDRCGERAERRWRDGDALVCADCASW